MSQLFYYDKDGQKKPTTSSELKTMALEGVIDKNTVIETEDGKRSRAEKVNGLVFPEDAGSATTPKPQPFPSPISGETQKVSGASTGTKCPSCGGDVAPGQKFCSQCGANVDSVPSASSQNCCRQCGAKLQPNQTFCSSCGARQDGTVVPSATPNVGDGQTGGKNYNKTTAGILGILLGSLGIHKFYLGSWGWGIVFILLSCTGLPSICGLVEGIIYLTTNENDFNAKYNLTPSSPFRW
jgi:TM2 domain-containing membrane protein YozV